jgi:hypothetical protein
MKRFLVLVLVVVTAWFAFAVGREVGREEAAAALGLSWSPPDTSFADTTVRSLWRPRLAQASSAGSWIEPLSVLDDSLIVPSEAAVVELCGRRCGVQRWAVKTLGDPDRKAVDPRPVDTTIEALAAIPRPEHVPSDRRVAPHETTIYRVRAYLAELDEESDGDLHLVLVGLDDLTASLIAEIPDPACRDACSSGFAGRYGAARAALLSGIDELAARGSTDTIVLEIIGVGFFDHPHGQTGAASNYFELHPVLALRIVQ